MATEHRKRGFPEEWMSRTYSEASIALLLVLPWEENYGEKQDDADHSLSHQFVEGWKTTLSNSHIWRIGMTQALSEGAMYTFVFMWVPTMLSMNPPGGLPTGCVFSAMMMAITIGGNISRGTFELVIVSFLVVECCVGLFMPVAGTLRSKYVPDALQGAILNIFRLPLNVVVVSGTYATDVLEAPIVFKLVSGCFLAASLLQGTFLLETKPVVDSKKKD
ncbi:sugar transporter [Nitzschia inconspicua]|uniref:Sugar transporter n=1 Tax=Nitzschia inconspicua TaxID=303405 RepID=A0A9K3P7H8_9STRA|nr:sugar transporter [Nitzschia inconspicua]